MGQNFVPATNPPPGAITPKFAPAQSLEQNGTIDFIAKFLF
jgi:hypothetical protein